MVTDFFSCTGHWFLLMHWCLIPSHALVTDSFWCIGDWILMSMTISIYTLTSITFYLRICSLTVVTVQNMFIFKCSVYWINGTEAIRNYFTYCLWTDQMSDKPDLYSSHLFSSCLSFIFILQCCSICFWNQIPFPHKNWVCFFFICCSDCLTKFHFMVIFVVNVWLLFL